MHLGESREWTIAADKCRLVDEGAKTSALLGTAADGEEPISCHRAGRTAREMLQVANQQATLVAPTLYCQPDMTVHTVSAAFSVARSLIQQKTRSTIQDRD
jgi:hypothetical protein